MPETNSTGAKGKAAAENAVIVILFTAPSPPVSMVTGRPRRDTCTPAQGQDGVAAVARANGVLWEAVPTCV